MLFICSASLLLPWKMDQLLFLLSFLACLLFYLSPDSILQMPEYKIYCTVRVKVLAICKTETHVAGEMFGPWFLSACWQACSWLSRKTGSWLFEALQRGPDVPANLPQVWYAHRQRMFSSLNHLHGSWSSFPFSVLAGDSDQLFSILWGISL